MQLKSTVTLACTAILTSAPSWPANRAQAIERLADGIEPGQRDSQRALLLGSARDLINPVAQFEIGVAQRLFRGQECQRRRAARCLLGNGVR